MDANYDLEERLLEYSARIIRLVERLPNTRAGNHIAERGQACRLHGRCSLSDSERALEGIRCRPICRSRQQANTGASRCAQVKAAGDLLYRERGLLAQALRPGQFGRVVLAA